MSVTMSDAEPRRLHPAWIVYSAIQSLRALAFPILLAIVAGGRSIEFIGLIIGLGFAAVLIPLRLVAWLRFAYHVDPAGIRVRSGVLGVTDRFLPRERVQSVDITENLLHRLLGVVALRIESAAGGSGEADITLEALGRGVAESLRADLLASGLATSAPDGSEHAQVVAPIDEGELIAGVSYGRLVAAGATAGQVGPLFAAVFGAVQVFDELLTSSLRSRVEDVTPNPTIQLITTLVVLGGIVSWLFSIAWTVITYGGFEIRLIGERLHISYGLLERRRVTIPRARIQAVTISEGLLRQPFGLAEVRAESAGYGQDRGQTGVLMPIMPKREIAAFLQRACPRYATDPFPERSTWQGPPPRALRRYATRPVWPILTLTGLATLVAGIVPSVSWEWGLLGLALLPAGVALGIAQFRATGWRIPSDGTLVVRGRPLNLVTSITRPNRLQLRGVSENPLQRRARLVSFAATVASGGSGGSLAMDHLDRDDALRLLDHLTPRSATRVPARLLDNASARL